MYLEHFGLRDFPFRLTADLDYYYASSGHARARSYIDFSVVSRDGFVVITGEVGSGKTTLLRKLLQELPTGTPVVHIEQTQLTPIELLQTVWHGLGGEKTTQSKVELIRWLREGLENLHRKNTRLVIAIDEAQGLSVDVLEEIRMLSGVELHKEKLISIVLLGQSNLDRMIDRPDMEQLRQRVRLRFCLAGLTMAETLIYIRLRLEVANAPKPERLLPEAACVRIHEYTGGIPRLINTLCDTALLCAYVDEKYVVDDTVVLEAIEELGWRPYREDNTVSEVAMEEEAPQNEDGSTAMVVPMTLLGRIADTLENMDGRLERMVSRLESNSEAGLEGGSGKRGKERRL